MLTENSLKLISLGGVWKEATGGINAQGGVSVANVSFD